MNRVVIGIVLASLLLCGCSRQQTPQPSSQPSAPTAKPAGGSSLAAAAAKVTDACSLVPAELAQKLVPGASTPQSEQFPKRCTLGNGKSALEITFDSGPGEAIKGAEFVPGIGEGGYLERLNPTSKGDAYLTVILGEDATGTNRNLHVEVSGHDGKEHKDDAIEVARAILARLH